MLGIFADVFKRATYQDVPRADVRGDWRPPVHWKEDDRFQKGQRHD